MISRPLLSMVAESMVMRRPITQVGCFSACSGVMEANCSSGSWRNGPPEAVSQMVLTSACAPTRMHWWTALCSLSMGRMGTLRSRAARGEDFAGGHHALLVGQADRLAGQDGGVGGFKTGHADDGGDDEVGFGQRGAGDGALRCRERLRSR